MPKTTAVETPKPQIKKSHTAHTKLKQRELVINDDSDKWWWIVINCCCHCLGVFPNPRLPKRPMVLPGNVSCLGTTCRAQLIELWRHAACGKSCESAPGLLDKAAKIIQNQRKSMNITLFTHCSLGNLFTQIPLLWHNELFRILICGNAPKTRSWKLSESQGGIIFHKPPRFWMISGAVALTPGTQGA